jgi:hypothetical protein
VCIRAVGSFPCFYVSHPAARHRLISLCRCFTRLRWVRVQCGGWRRCCCWCRCRRRWRRCGTAEPRGCHQGSRAAGLHQEAPQSNSDDRDADVQRRRWQSVACVGEWCGGVLRAHRLCLLSKRRRRSRETRVSRQTPPNVLPTLLSARSHLLLWCPEGFGDAFAALRCVALRCVALRCVALRCVALRCGALRCVALRCVALRCVALRCCVGVNCAALPCCSSRTTRRVCCPRRPSV